MTDISGELLDSVHAAGACLVDIRELAGKLAHLPAVQIEPLLLRFADDGDDQAVSRLLQTCAFNEVKLDPTVLCRCVGVCEEILDSAPCFALQDESAVQPLLASTAGISRISSIGSWKRVTLLWREKSGITVGSTRGFGLTLSSSASICWRIRSALTHWSTIAASLCPGSWTKRPR